jgi:hypothetical protein
LCMVPLVPNREEINIPFDDPAHQPASPSSVSSTVAASSH